MRDVLARRKEQRTRLNYLSKFSILDEESIGRYGGTEEKKKFYAPQRLPEMPRFAAIFSCKDRSNSAAKTGSSSQRLMRSALLFFSSSTSALIAAMRAFSDAESGSPGSYMMLVVSGLALKAQ